MKRKLINTVRNYSRELKAAGIPVTALYVFSSQVKGTANKWSDIDVCVISPIFGKDRQAERIKLMNLRDTVTLNIEPHPYSPEDFNIPYDPLASEIRKTGIQIS